MNSFILLFLSILSYTYSAAQKEYVKVYYTDGSIKEEGWLQDNQKVDFWIAYYKSGQIKEKGHYKLNQRHQYWYYYRSNGKMKSEGHYLNDKKDSWWSFYNDSGKIIYRCQLKNDKLNGYCLHYKSSEIVKVSKYSEGKKQEEWTDYSLFIRENNLQDLR